MEARAGSLDDILGTQMKAVAAVETAKAASGGAGTNVAAGNMNGNSGGEQGSTKLKKRGSLDEILGIKVGNRPGKGSPTGTMATILQKGDIVEALAPAPSTSDGRPPTFSLGVIRRVHDDGGVDVDLDMGDELVKRPSKEIRLVQKNGSSSGQLPVAIGDLTEGDRVEAR